MTASSYCPTLLLGRSRVLIGHLHLSSEWLQYRKRMLVMASRDQDC